MRQLRGTEVLQAEVCFGGSAVDNQQGRTGLAATLRFYLMCRPGSALVTQAEGSELLHRPAFQRFFNIHRKADAVIKPGGDLGVVSLVSRAWRTLHCIAIARAKLGFTQRSLARAIAMRFQKILI